jgi:hypothetical protein
MTSIVKFGSHEIEIAKLPPATISWAIQKAFNHEHGSVVSSAVGNEWYNEGVKLYKDSNPGVEITKEKREELKKAAKDTLDPESPWYKAKTDELRAESLKAILDGTIGDGNAERGPRLSPIEQEIAAECRAFVKTELLTRGEKQVTTADGKVKAAWGTKGTSWPQGSDVFKFASGDRTWDSLLSGALAHAKFGAEIRKRAQSALDEKARKEAKRLAEAAKTAEAEIAF